MPQLKYFEKVIATRRADRKRANQPLPAFDFESLATPSSFKRGLTRFLLRRVLPALCFVLRRLWPNPRLGRIVFVTRAEDVRTVLSDTEQFRVVYGLEMVPLGGGANNVLGMDGRPHDRTRAGLQGAIRTEDIDLIAKTTREDARALLAAGGGRIDIFGDLISRTATEASCRFFGLTVHDPDAFAKWSMAVSNQLFGDYFGDSNIHEQARIGSAQLAALIDDSILRVHANNAEHPKSRRKRVTLIDRLVTDMKLSPAQVRATIIGLVTAFVPTNTLAAGNIVEVLIDDRRLWERASTAAANGDAFAMEEVLLEAARLNPALSPGLWRYISNRSAPPMLSPGRWGRRQLRHGDLVLAIIPSALRDIGKFTGPQRRQHQWLMFGHGPHNCLGDRLAMAHLTAVFMELMALPDLRIARGKHGRMMRVGPYPSRLDLTFRSPASVRANIIVSLPVREDVERIALEGKIRALGNPARLETMPAKGLTATGRIQFASLSVIETAPSSNRSVLILEVSGDGDEEDLLGLIADKCHKWLAPIAACCQPAGQTLDAAQLAALLVANRLDLNQRPWGSTGLHFDGLASLSVADIERQEKVAAFARDVVGRRLKRRIGLNSRAMDTLQWARRLIKQDSFYALRTDWSDLLARGKPLQPAIIRPALKRMPIADWTPPKNRYEPLVPMLKARENWPIGIGLLLLVAAWSGGIWLWLTPRFGTSGVLLSATLAAIGGLLLASLTIVGLVAAFAAYLRRLERREPRDDRAASLDRIKAFALCEDAPGYAQNHIIAVMPFKPGVFRRLTFALAMWGIKQLVTHWFRPGFVLTMGTIHKARWFRIPGTSQFVFFSNYDGSWESYLEDFITRAKEGQTAAWTHGVGFPKTRFLVFDGAADGDRFKRWVRLQQRPTLFWYSRFPHLTAQQIRNHAMIEDGLARAASDTDARRWLANFGSAQREADELEIHEVQTLIFNGFGRQSEATALFVQFPSSPARLAAWLQAVSGLRARPVEALVGAPERWRHKDRKGRDIIRLPIEARIRFGEGVVEAGGAAFALTAEGLALAGLDQACGPDALPAILRMTMAGRSRLLGDEPDAVRQWRFSDSLERADRAHAMLMIYGREDGLDHADLVAGHELLLQHFGGSVVHFVPCKPVPGAGGKPSLDTEPFGFKDGISQPVIRGTRRSGQAVPQRDLIAAGEFLLGYRNQQGFIPPPVTVGPEFDPANDLPTIEAAAVNRFPFFGNRTSAIDQRDFGRNGTFIAVRMLDQNAEGFCRQTQEAAAYLQTEYPDLEELTGPIDEQWVAAKIIGRWRSGAPLVTNPQHSDDDQADFNDYAYGVDDPRGFGCPLGSHIRRANPRDSLEPADVDEQHITNRHRLIRRGRAYRYQPAGHEQQVEGLLFIALCADLERQFEFVQRTWLNAPAFHGLANEADPLFGIPANHPGIFNEAVFTIPTPAGPIELPRLESYIATRGGAYFFMPSRSAIAFLINRLARRELEEGESWGHIH